MHEGRLAIGGCDVLELAREFGTPAYVVAEDDLRARARDFLRAMADHHGERGAVAFASKAFPCTEVLRIFREEGLVVDVASAGELHLARRAGYEPKEIIFHGNAKSEAELATIAELGVMCVIDNLDEIERLGRHAARSPAAGDAAGRARGRDGHPSRRRDRPRRPEVRAHARGGPRGDRPAGRGGVGRPAGDPHAHRLPALRPRALPRGDRGDRRARAVRALRPRRRARRAVHPRAADALDRRVGRGGGGRRARAAGRPGQGARDRAGPRARRQRRGDALHRRVGQAPRVDVGGGRRRHVRQPAPDALRRALHRRRRRSPRLGRRARRALPPRGQALRVGRRDRLGRAACAIRGPGMSS